ncbi:MAG: ATP-binding protein [Rickettsiales bacterium]
MLTSSIFDIDFLHNEAPVHNANLLRQQPVRPYFFVYASHTSLDVLLEEKYHIFIEAGTHNELNSSLSQIVSDSPDLALCTSSKSAYGKPVAAAFTRSLVGRFGLGNTPAFHIETCLQEAITNAIIHGNLEVASKFSTAEEMETHYSLIEHKLTLMPYQNRRVTALVWDYESHLEIAIRDQGNGFDILEQQTESDLPHGRGLKLIQSMAEKIWIGRDNKTLHMTFNCQ